MFSSISRNLFKKAMKPNKLTNFNTRGIKLHEYQAAQLLAKFDVPVPNVRSLPTSKSFQKLSNHILYRVALPSTQKKLIKLLKIFTTEPVKDAS
jgi:hypothetical protein